MKRLNTESARVGLLIAAAGAAIFLVSTGATQPDAAAAPAAGIMERQITLGELLTFLGFCLTAAAVIWKGGKLEARLESVEVALGGLERFKVDILDERGRSIADRARLASEVESACERINRVESRQDAIVDSLKKGGRQP